MVTTSTRRKNANSAAAALEAAKAVNLPALQPPIHVKLKPEHMPFWSDILASRARAEWSKADLVVAAQLARCQYDIERHTDALNTEGEVLENHRGTSVMNPRHTILEQLSRRQMAFMRTLTLGGSLPGKARSDMDSARKNERTAADAKGQIENEDDPLLA